VVDLFEAQEPSDFGSDEVIDLSDDTGEALAWRIQTERDPYRAAGLEEIENNVLSLLSRYVKGGLDPLLHEMLVSSIPPYSRGLASYTLRQHEDGDQEDLESVVKNNFARVLARILEIADKQSDSS